LQNAALSYRFLLRSILRLWCAGFCAACRTLEVFVGYLRVVLRGNGDAVPHPRRDNMRRELFQ
jgi:hypothetical protein